MKEPMQPIQVDASTAQPPKGREYLKNALRGAVGMAAVGAASAAAVGAAVIGGLDLAGFADSASTLLNSVGMGNAVGASAALNGAATGAIAGLAMGVPAGAMGGLMGTRQKFVEETVIPNVAQAALIKGVEIGREQQQAIDMAQTQAETQSTKYRDMVVNSRAKTALASMEPMGRA